MDNARDVLSAHGVPPDAVAAVLREELEKAAKSQAAIDRASQDPYFKAHAPQMAEYLSQNEGLRESIERIGSDNPDDALDLLKLSYARSVGHTNQGQPQRQSAPAPRGRDYSRGTTVLPMPGTLSMPDVRPEPDLSHPVWGQGSDVDQARERYNRYPSRQNGVAYAKARLRTVISDEFLNQ